MARVSTWPRLAGSFSPFNASIPRRNSPARASGWRRSDASSSVTAGASGRRAKWGEARLSVLRLVETSVGGPEIRESPAAHFLAFSLTFHASRITRPRHPSPVTCEAFLFSIRDFPVSKLKFQSSDPQCNDVTYVTLSASAYLRALRVKILEVPVPQRTSSPSRITHHASRITHHASRITHHSSPVLLTNASFRLSGDHEGTFIVP